MILMGRKSISGSGPNDFLRWIRTQGEKVTIGHAGLGTNTHICAVMLGNALGTKLTYVSYRGSAPVISGHARREH